MQGSTEGGMDITKCSHGTAGDLLQGHWGMSKARCVRSWV